jgi:hypothetical protein
MSFEPGNPNIDIVALIEIEVGHRIDQDSWIAEPGYNTYYIVHSNYSAEWGELEGEPVNIEEDSTRLSKVTSLNECRLNQGTWFYESSSKYLYIHCSDSGQPSGHIIVAYILRRFGSKIYEFQGRVYLPFLKEDSIGDINYSTSLYHEGGTKQSFSSIKLINFSGFFDKDLANYIYEAKLIIGRIGRAGDNEENFQIFLVQWTGDIIWSDEYIEISIEDLRECLI